MLAYYLVSLILSSILIGIDKGGVPGIGSLGITVSILLLRNTKHIIAIFTPVLFCSDIYVAYILRNKADWIYVRSIAPSFLLGLLIGWMLITLFSNKIIRLIAGLGLLLLSIIHWFLKYICKYSILPINNVMNNNSYLFKIQNSIFMKYSVGIFAGILSTVANVAGPVVAIFLSTTSNKSPITITSTR